jgi:hypothetical protein
VVAFARLHHKSSAPATSETLATLAHDYVDPNKSLGTCIDVEHAVHIFQVNAAAMGYTGELGSGVFKSFSRINHSCTPNVHHSYNPTLKKLTVHATRHINKGEEILTAYTNLDRTYGQRTDLLSNWHMRCECKCCAGPNADASKGRRVRMFEADQKLACHAKGVRANLGLHIPHTPKEALEVAEELLTLMREEAITNYSLSGMYVSREVPDSLARY